MPEEIK